MVRIIIFIAFIGLTQTCVSQVSLCAKDSTIIQSPSICGALGYYPVCACNTTYRNECFSTASGYLSYNPGPCEEFALDFFPNVLTDELSQSFRPTILSKRSNGCTIFIMDVYGVVYINMPIFTSSFISNVQSTPAFQDIIDLSRIKHGMYLFIVVGGNQTITKKLVRVD